MKITTSQFDYNYNGSTKAGNDMNGFYVFHNVDVFNSIMIDDIELQAIYQTGMSYTHNDYSFPRNELELSEDAGTDEVLMKINDLYESDFDDINLIDNVLEKIKELCPLNNNADKLFKIYQTLNDNRPALNHFLDHEIYTDEVEDYVEDEETGALTLKVRRKFDQ